MACFYRLAGMMPRVLVFGESDNDRHAIQQLLRGLRNDLRVEVRRDPMVLIKGALPANAKSSAEKIAALARADPRRVVAVVAHQDCDAVEPAHEATAAKIESELASAGCPQPIGVTPAWELEAWWLVFPEAVGKIVKGWRDPDDWLGRNVGVLANAKEALIRAVRPRGLRATAPREYAERDSVEVARNVVDDNLLPSFANGRRVTSLPNGAQRSTWSRSFERFRKRVLAIP